METTIQRQAIVAILQGLSRYGSLKWTVIPEKVRGALLRCCTRELSSCRGNDAKSDNSKLAAIIIRSLGRLQASWDDVAIPMSFKEMLKKSIMEACQYKSDEIQINLGYVVANVINGK